MVSRRKILSRSRDDLNLVECQQDEEDVWYQKDKLLKEHIAEVLDKWGQIDDEIWAKIIVFEKNRRVAKAYARTPVLTINGSNDGFDGMRIGLCGFDNPMRDHKTDEVKRHISQGVKLKMDDNGNILVRRYSKSGIYVKSLESSSSDENAIGNEILKSPNQMLEFEKVMKVFDMKKFESNVNRELGRAYPDRRRLETQCLSAIAFAKNESDVLECPIWVLIINVVAIDMLKSKLPPIRRLDIKNRPRIPIPDEDPYAIAADIESSASSSFGNGVYGHHGRDKMMAPSQYRRDKPPKLPPRGNIYVHRDEVAGVMKADYDEIDDDGRVKLMFQGRPEKNVKSRKYDDPYYCGLKARVPNFAKANAKRKQKDQEEEIYVRGRKSEHAAPFEGRHRQLDRHQPTFSSLYQLNQINDPRSSLYQRLHHHSHNMMSPNQQRPFMWHARSYESGIDSEIIESPYQLYGRLPFAKSHVTRQMSAGAYVSSSNSSAYRSMHQPGNFIGDWE